MVLKLCLKAELTNLHRQSRSGAFAAEPERSFVKKLEQKLICFVAFVLLYFLGSQGFLNGLLSITE